MRVAKFERENTNNLGKEGAVMMSVVSTRYGKMSIIDADNVISRALALYGEWAMDEINLLAQLITPSMCVLDVGAFIGSHTLAFSKLVGRDGKVYSFEPRKEIYDILSKNLSINDLHNVTPLNIGLAEKEQFLNLRSLDINQAINFGGLALDANDNSQSSNTYQVSVSTIDGLNTEKIDMIKLDVEGMERRVLDGAIKTILRDRPIIFCECNSLNSGSEVLEFCQTTNYRTYGFLASAYNPNNFNSIKENIFGAANELALLLIPREKTAEIQGKITSAKLLPIWSPEDLVLPLLHKPQYPYEVLAKTSSYPLLGIDFPSPVLAERDAQIDRLSQALTDSDELIANHVTLLAQRDAQIAQLSQALTDRDVHIKNYRELLAERYVKIEQRNPKVADRDELVANYDTLLAQRDGQIANLQQRESEYQVLVKELRNAIDRFSLSTSWRITKPLRVISRWVKRLVHLIQLYQTYRQMHPGMKGFHRLAMRCVGALRTGGVAELRTNIAVHQWSRTTATPQSSIAVLLLDDTPDAMLILPKDVAVHAHIFYPDLTAEIRSYLENIPVKFNFYVTTDTLEKAKLIKDAFANMENILALDIVVTENRGRDIFPMLVSLGDKLAKHEIVLHFHTKRSPHNSWLLGGWRRYMMESLLGNPQRIFAILQQFVKDKTLGILFPDPYHLVKPFIHMPSNANEHNMKQLLALAGKSNAELEYIDKSFFPAGDMFWFRGKAIQSFIEMGLSAKHFEPEEGQVDATLAHAIERMFPYFAQEQGLITKAYISTSFLSQQCSAHKFELFNTYIEKGLFHNSILLFDHNLGGGANTYTRELVKDTLSEGRRILRVYNFDGIWFVQWIADGDGMLFYTRSIDELFKALVSTHVTNLILNSLYGCPDIKDVISKILNLVKELKIPVDIKMHDFFAVCPSPHLSNFKEVYCEVPQDYADCSHCLKNNLSWYPNWFPKENQPVDIVNWRQPFISLIQAATTVTFFDVAPIEIFRRAFHLEASKIRIVPHTVEYFKCNSKIDLFGPLHIGILGTLTNIKGGKVVHALSDHIKKNGLRVPITVIGPDHVDTPDSINVHGPYEPNHLPALILNNGINIILAPSIVPETFGYTISEAMIMGLPIVAFDIGAQGNRVKKYELGKVIPLDSSPEVLLAALQSTLKKAKELKK
jgi:FkbM family methyltransferase